MSRCTYPEDPKDGKFFVIIFKGKGQGPMAKDLQEQCPKSVLLQWGPKGSYSEKTVLDYMRCRPPRG